MNTKPSMATETDQARATSAPVSKAAPTPAAVAGGGVLTFTKEDLISLATRGDTIGIRKSAAEALYTMGRCDGAASTGDRMMAAFDKVHT